MGVCCVGSSCAVSCVMSDGMMASHCGFTLSLGRHCALRAHSRGTQKLPQGNRPEADIVALPVIAGHTSSTRVASQLLRVCRSQDALQPEDVVPQGALAQQPELDEKPLDPAQPGAPRAQPAPPS